LILPINSITNVLYDLTLSGTCPMYLFSNTCYLNSSVQCLSHTPILREYFTSKAFYNDINRTNPLGYEGRLAQVSAVLINELWKRSSVTPHQNKRLQAAPGVCNPLHNAPALTPKTFKESLGKFNDIFAGNEQHDAQELLAFLLGGLSEDLNRIVEKPYIEAPDSDGRPDSELADIWWSNHLKREMSIVVALFTGQYKSLLTCKNCKYESARFEPFSFLQLPLPEDEHLQAYLTYYPCKEGEPPMRYRVRVRNDGSLNDVLIALAKVLVQDERDGEGDEDNEIIKTATSADEVDDEVLKRAQNLTVVVMRDGYISRLAPGSWLLQEQQIKESGELPRLFVYELDPITEPEFTEKNNQDDADDEELYNEPSPAYINVAQRRSELASRDFLHPLTHRVFGIPLILRINRVDKFSGRDMYDLIAKRLKGVVPKGALRLLSKEKSSSKADVSSEDEKDLSKSVSRGVLRKTTTDMEDVAAGPVPRYGFRLRLTSRDGRKCQRCPWFECCIGCFIPDDDMIPVQVKDGDSLAVDWHFAVDVATNGFGFRVSGGDAIFANQPPSSRVRIPPVVSIKSHSSCGNGPRKGSQPGAVTLEECLDAFAKEERIPEAYCSKCKDFRVQTKRMSLWRLPPVVIIHLKRFQFTQTMRRKLRDLVVFPIEGLDLSRIMARDSTGAGHGNENSNGAPTSANGDFWSVEGQKDDGRSEMLYDLYGVIHHQGALTGGHYVASLKSELDGQWRLFNDAQIFDINDRDIVDPSAYILFYIRRDVSKAQLSDYWDVREGGLSDEEMDQLLRSKADRCVIS
jgi:ubiquitin carboxyl-terminal hydrolase 6/32